MICSYLLHGYDVILILKLHRRTQLRFVLLYSLRIRMTSCPCNKYEQITPSYLLSVNYVVYSDYLFFLLTPRSCIHSLKNRMTSHPCNKYEQIMLSYLLSVNVPRFYCTPSLCNCATVQPQFYCTGCNYIIILMPSRSLIKYFIQK